jgi:hypothetical protein
MQKIFAPENNRELIRGWLVHARKGWKKHEKAARRLQGRYRLIGSINVILSAIVGGTLFQSLARDQELWWVKLGAGFFSVSASVLASLMTFQRYEERTEKHRAAGVDYKGALQSLERLHTQLHEQGAAHLDQKELTRIYEQFRALEKMAPVIPNGIDDDVECSYEAYTFESKVDHLRSSEGKC